MRQFLGILLIAAAIYGAKQIIDHYEQIQRRQARREFGHVDDSPATTNRPAATVLPGFRAGYEAQLESSLAEARRLGAAGIRNWLKEYGHYVSDPRLADIELDYIILLGPANRVEARRVLSGLAKRIQPGSPVYERFKKIEKTYQ